MRRQTKIWLVVIAILAVSALIHVYYLVDGSGATLFSRGDEAYLFLASGHEGYRVSYLAFPFAIVREYFNAPISRTDYGGCSLVIRVTASKVERFLTHCGDPDLQYVAFVTPFEDGFYAMCRLSIVCKWTESGFVPATQEETRRVGGVSGLVKGDMKDQTVNGWNVRYARMPGDHVEVPISSELIISVRNRATDVPKWQDPWITVDLLRPGQSPQTLYDVNGKPRRVSKREYEDVFRQTSFHGPF
jgi:hypothetical protein